MNIAVISDIHGNVEALKAVLEDINNEQCEKIFVLGDYAMAGPEPSEVVDFFFKKQFDYNYTMIQGNTDLMITTYTEDLYKSLKSKAPVMAEALKNDVTVLNTVQKEFLKSLPAQKQIEYEGVKFLLVHGSPRYNNEDILPDTSLDHLEQILQGVNADVILCGHTHIPCGFQTVTKQTVVNAGSIGRPFTNEPKACYLKLTVLNGKCMFEHRFIKYDKEAAAKKLLTRGFIGSEKLAKTLLNPVDRHF